MLSWAQQRVKDAVVKEVHFSEADPDRFERDLQGTWEACGVNSTLLFARYAKEGTRASSLQCLLIAHRRPRESRGAASGR